VVLNEISRLLTPKPYARTGWRNGGHDTLSRRATVFYWYICCSERPSVDERKMAAHSDELEAGVCSTGKAFELTDQFVSALQVS